MLCVLKQLEADSYAKEDVDRVSLMSRLVICVRHHAGVHFVMDMEEILAVSVSAGAI